MGVLWVPGAERQPESNGGSMAGGPPRVIWHVTWDQLGAGGRMPRFDSVARYLRGVDFCPHLMWDPWGGRIMQFYPATTSARAVRNRAGGVETNRQGSVCLQIETWFSPGAVVNGVKYATVADTPCVNLERIMGWARGWGVPDVWPGGWPRWSGNSRDSSRWVSQAGHYGHSQVPENDHDDPGPMPRSMFRIGVPTPGGAPGLVAPSGVPALRAGSTGAAVRQLQKCLNHAGLDPNPGLVVDGDFGAATGAAVGAFQRAHGLPVDHVYGPATARALTAAVA